MKLWVTALVIAACLCPINASCAGTTPFMDGTCMNDIYGMIMVEVSLQNVSNILLNLGNVISSVGNSWNLNTTSPTYTIAPADNGIANTYFNVYQTTDGMTLGSLINESTMVSNTYGLVIVAVNSTASPNSPFNAYWNITATNPETGLNRTGKILFEFFDPVCAATIAQIDQYLGSPPVPESTIAWNNETQTMDFTITSVYLRNSQTIVLDFEDFKTSTHNVRQSTTCGNRPDLSSMPFGYLWNSAETLDQPNALEGMFGAYPPTSTTKWTTTPLACDTIQYSASFSLSDLSSCTNREGGFSVSVSTSGPATNQSIVYEGTLYWNVVRPVNPSDESLGYTSIRTMFPFKFSFQSSFSIVVSSVSEIVFYVFVRSAHLTNDGDLSMVVEVQYPGTGVSNATASGPSTLQVSPPVPSDCQSNSADALCIQQFTYTESQWTNADNGQYVLNWTSPTGQIISARVEIQQHQYEQVINSGISYGSCSLAVFDSNEADMRSGENKVNTDSHLFNPEDEILIRADVALGASDQENFNLTIVNAWICYTDIVGYTWTAMGCLDPLVQANGMLLQLLSDSAVVQTSETALYNTRLIQGGNWTNATGPSTGMGFAALPLTTSDHTYVVHVEVVMSQTTRNKKRSIGLFASSNNQATQRLKAVYIPPSTVNLVPEQTQQQKQTLAAEPPTLDYFVLYATGLIGIIITTAVSTAILTARYLKSSYSTPSSQLNGVLNV